MSMEICPVRPVFLKIPPLALSYPPLVRLPLTSPLPGGKLAGSEWDVYGKCDKGGACRKPFVSKGTFHPQAPFIVGNSPGNGQGENLRIRIRGYKKNPAGGAGLDMFS